MGPNDFLICVGDVVSLTAKQMGLQPNVFVCDYKTKRGDQDPNFVAELSTWGDQEIRVDNPAAQVTRAAWQAVRDAIAAEGTTRIVVEGEEDLLGLPAFMEAPLGAKVLYGAPGRGMILVTIDEEFRESVAFILQRMQ
ncbi:MAG: GTP-dependent dephospho-CoA kinase family protein [Thermoplasmatota archaeon]